MKQRVIVFHHSNWKDVEEMFQEHKDWDIVDDINDADLAVFTGGSDVNPALYGQHKHSSTHFDVDRDKQDQEYYMACYEQGIPMIGICRGGQFLNVMNGGRLYQDVDGHAIPGVHKAFLNGAIIPVDVTSTHHQMMVPNHKTDVKIMLSAGESSRRIEMNPLTGPKIERTFRYEKGSGRTDVEGLFYPDTKSFCFQPHPEYRGRYADETREVFFELIERYIFSDEEGVLLEEA